ncbi:MAG: PHP domain-containing protein [Oscillospiraceae bacterium]|nr:PHP domain-containing protein [Oscillospiraceae bacterium]
MFVTDFHTHTCASPDSRTTLPQLLAAAEAAGVRELAVTDHAEGSDALQAASASYEAAAAFAAAYNGPVRLARGIELGQPLADEARSRAVLAAHAWDVVLLSQHDSPEGEDYYRINFNGRHLPTVMRAYLWELLRVIEWGHGHVLAHLTYPLRYMPPFDHAGYGDELDAVLRAVAARGLALEINTGGLRSRRREINPAPEVVRRFFELGGELITVGSDAHRAADVGAHFEDGCAVARAAGFRYHAVFFGGKAKMQKL